MKSSLLQVADNMPLYGVCCYMDEIVHRPPSILKDVYPDSTAPLSRYLVSAPRCYCLLTHYPFFSLHLKVGTQWQRQAFLSPKNVYVQAVSVAQSKEECIWQSFLREAHT